MQATLAIEEARKNLIAKSKREVASTYKEKNLVKRNKTKQKNNVIQVEEGPEAGVCLQQDKNKIINLVQSRPRKLSKVMQTHCFV